MMARGGARKGGMPLYKYVGNQILTRVQNAVVGLASASGTSGTAPFGARRWRRSRSSANSDGFDFDTEIIIQLHAAGQRIVEVPIPTYYGDEICYVNGLATQRRHRPTWCATGSHAWASASPLPGTEAPRRTSWKPDHGSSHA